MVIQHNIRAIYSNQAVKDCTGKKKYVAVYEPMKQNLIIQYKDSTKVLQEGRDYRLTLTDGDGNTFTDINEMRTMDVPNSIQYLIPEDELYTLFVSAVEYGNYSINRTPLYTDRLNPIIDISNKCIDILVTVDSHKKDELELLD